MNVIARQTEPNDSVSSMVTIVKPDNICICLDPQDLNKAIQLEHYPLLTVEEVLSNTPNTKVFSVLDANQRFCQIKLEQVENIEHVHRRIQIPALTVQNIISIGSIPKMIEDLV